VPEVPGDNVGCGDNRGSQGACQDYYLGKAAGTGASSGRLCSFTS